MYRSCDADPAQLSKMADEVDKLFLFGDDLEAILDVIEEDAGLQEEFVASVSNSQLESREIVCSYGKKYKTKGGYNRHRATKHAENQRKTVELTADILAEIVINVVCKIKAKKVYDESLRNEIAEYAFQMAEGSQQFTLLRTIFDALQKKGDSESFYSNFFGNICLNATKYFTGLSRNAATLLTTKVADSMLAYCKKQKDSATSASEIVTKMTEKQNAGLQYIGGYVLHNLHKKHSLVKSDESFQAMAILKAGKLENMDPQQQKLVSCVNRGGLWAITLPAQKIFMGTDTHFRQSTLKSASQKIDINGIVLNSTSDSELLANYNLILSGAECKPDTSVAKNVLQDIVSLYVRVHSFSHAKDIVQRYKIKSKHIKKKALHTEISRSCEQSQSRHS